MSSSKDVSKWPIEVRLSTFNQLSSLIDQKLQELFPATQGYLYDDPYLFRDRAYLSISYKVTRGNDWGISVLLKVGTLTDTTGQMMTYTVSSAVPYQEDMFIRSFLIGGLAGIAGAIWVVMNISKWIGPQDGSGVIIFVLAGFLFFTATAGATYILQLLFSNPSANRSTSVHQDVERVENAFDLSAMLDMQAIRND